MRLVDRGRGPPVLLLHGNPDSAELWAGVIARLGPRFRCLAPDLPGFGRSAAPDDLDRSPDGMARFVAALLAAAGVVAPVHLVVHDLGGRYGLAWAVRHPARVRRIAVINSVFHADYRGHFWARVWRTPVLGELAMALLSRRGFARELRRGSPGLDPAYVRHAHGLFTPAVRREVLRLYRALDPEELAAGGWEEGLLRLTARAPTCVLWGDRDPYIPAAYAERFGAAEVHHFPERGHWLPAEAAEEVAERLARFFSG